MSKLFYDHLILLDEIDSLLDKHGVDADQRHGLVALIDETLHHHTLAVILDHLPEAHHDKFLASFASAPHDPQLLTFLKERIKIDIEAAIKDQARTIKSEIIAEIGKLKQPRLRR